MIPVLSNIPLGRPKNSRYFNDRHARDSPEPEDLDMVSTIAQYGYTPARQHRVSYASLPGPRLDEYDHNIRYQTLNHVDFDGRPRLTPCINCVRLQVKCFDKPGARGCQHCYQTNTACITPQKRRSLKKKVRFDLLDDDEDETQSEPELPSTHQHTQSPKQARVQFTDATSRRISAQVSNTSAMKKLDAFSASSGTQVNTSTRSGRYGYDSEPETESFSRRETRTVVRTHTINSAMTPTAIAQVLGNHGCTNLTDILDLQSCSDYSVSSGGFGDVFSGRLKNGIPVAIKVTRLYIIQRQSGKHLKHAAEELHTWSKCRHPNVLELLGLAEFRGQIAMISPWINNGSVREYLNRRPNADRCQVCHGIARGLAYLHSIRIIHGDLKGANVLISDDGVPMLTDFGNSVLQDCSVQFTNSTVKQNMSPRWTAPEVFQGTVAYSYEADVFGLGMTLLETITGEIPYSNLRRDEAVITAIMITRAPPERPEAHIPTCSSHGDRLWTLLISCWAYQPEARPSAAEASELMKTVTCEGLRNLTWAPRPKSYIL